MNDVQLMVYESLVWLVDEIRSHSFRAITDTYSGHVDDTITTVSPSQYQITDGTGEEAVCIIFFKADNTYSLRCIPYSKINTITPSQGLSYVNSVLSLVINPDSSEYLELSEAGISIKKIIDYIDETAKKSGMFNLNKVLGVNTQFTLETALQALEAAHISTYEGFVFTYKTETGWDSYQNKGKDDHNEDIWEEFGAGTKATDQPASDSELAFSAKGAYNHLPVAINKYYDQDKQVTQIWLENAAGTQIGPKIEISGGGGSGSGGQSDFEFLFESAALYVKQGDKIKAYAYIRSTTSSSMMGTIAQNIVSVAIKDASTNQLLGEKTFNKASSTNRYDFEFDLSEYVTTVGATRRFIFTATDALGRTQDSPVLTAMVVNVTIKSENTLYYEPARSIAVSQTPANDQVSIPLFSYPASTTTIRTDVDIMVNGVWYNVGQSTGISPTQPQYFTFKRQFTSGGRQVTLTHGTYLVRVHGTAVLSNGGEISGNYLYTTIYVVDPNEEGTLLAVEWIANEEVGTVQRYAKIEFNYAAYKPGATEAEITIEDITVGQEELATLSIRRDAVNSYSKQITDATTDGSLVKKFAIVEGNVFSPTVEYMVLGKVIDVEAVTALLALDFTMEGRPNDDSQSNRMINGHELTLEDCNYNSNGFVKDSNGVAVLKFSDDMTGHLAYPMFQSATIANTGAAIQFKMKVTDVFDENATLMECSFNNCGFKVTGKQVMFSSNLESMDTNTTSRYDIPLNTEFDVTLLVEPIAVGPYEGVGMLKMFMDGELVGCCSYSSIYAHTGGISFDSHNAAVELYFIKAWATYFDYMKSFHHYLLKMSDTDEMVREYNFNDVFVAQEAEGNTKLRPQRQELFDRDIVIVVMCRAEATVGTADQDYPNYVETLKGDKKTSAYGDFYIYWPNRPWANMVIKNAPVTNQGTTSSVRPIKNIKVKCKKCDRIELLNPRSMFEDDPDALAKYDACAANASKKKFTIFDDSIPTNVFTLKVDYSESGGANNGAMMDLCNQVQDRLGANYRTPAQNFYSKPYKMYTSIRSITCAFFRTDKRSADPCSPNYGYFHAKGNFNEDKSDPAWSGFEDADGYNKGCLNYGKFYELVASKNQTLNDFVAAQDKSTWEFVKEETKDPDTGETVVTYWDVIVCSEWCGPNRRIFRKVDGVWTETTGTMTFDGEKWVITGDVVNPVECYELRKYDKFCWFQDVDTPEDLMVLDDNGKPLWTQYYESRYPDDDILNEMYEDGRKVPYQLYRWIQWCNQCNQNRTSADGRIEIDGVSVVGTPENRLTKFQRELHKYANVYSALYYHVLTDYLAAVDQRSKNMMISPYLDKDGVMRMYFNHAYDGDTILGSDNDCGLTISVYTDPDAPMGTNDYQGRDSVLFRQLANLKAAYDANIGSPTFSDIGRVWVTDYNGNPTAENTLSLDQVADAMRKTTDTVGQQLFSPVGLERLWITERLGKWPKTVSSYDGIRKYVETAESADEAYFYAVHGLGLQRLRRFINERFRYRDDFYGINTYINYKIEARVATAAGQGTPKITIKAGKDGMFGLGVDNAHTATKRKYLKAGESVTFESGSAESTPTMLYVYGADRIAEIDFNGAYVSSQGLVWGNLPMMKKMILGSSTPMGATPAGDSMQSIKDLKLPTLPFLEELDLTNMTDLLSVETASPRLRVIKAKGTKLTSFKVAEASKIETLYLPDTLKEINLSHVPNLVYPTGFQIDSLANITTLVLNSNPHIDEFQLLQDCFDAGAQIKEIKLTPVNRTAPASVLTTLKSMGARGYNSLLTSLCDGISGRWVLTTLLEDEEFHQLQQYFPKLGSNLHNAQYTTVYYDDANASPANMYNLDNESSLGGFTPSGHFKRILDGRIPVIGIRQDNGKWRGKRLMTTDYKRLKDGGSIDILVENGHDCMMYVPGFYYKGVNDFINSRKYIFGSSQDYEPLSTASTTVRLNVAEQEYRSGYALYPRQATLNSSLVDNVLYSASSYKTYRVDVEGFKQVRWGGVSNSAIGAAFTDADNVVISTVLFYNTATDFTDGDYLFTRIPEGAKYFFFSALAVVDEPVILTDSEEVEAIEPDWVYSHEFLYGIYKATDSSVGLRSIGGNRQNVWGSGNTTVGGADGWNYGADYIPLNKPAGLEYNAMDLINCAMFRGKGYQTIDYEMSKNLAHLVMISCGTRDVLDVKGSHSSSYCGALDDNAPFGMTDTVNGQNDTNGQKVLGVENFTTGVYEVLSNVIINAASYAAFMGRHAISSSQDKVDYVWHIYDPLTKTERTVQALQSSGNNIIRCKHGKYCDIIPSKVEGVNYDGRNYTDLYASPMAACSIPSRGGVSNSGANGVTTSVATSFNGGSYQYSTRLAFLGDIIIDD